MASANDVAISSVADGAISNADGPDLLGLHTVIVRCRSCTFAVKYPQKLNFCFDAPSEAGTLQQSFQAKAKVELSGKLFHEVSCQKLVRFHITFVDIGLSWKSFPKS